MAARADDGGVPVAHLGPQRRCPAGPCARATSAISAQRGLQVLVDVDGQGLEGRDVDHLGRALDLRRPLGGPVQRRRWPRGIRPGSCPSRSGRRSGCPRRPPPAASPCSGARSARRGTGPEPRPHRRVHAGQHLVTLYDRSRLANIRSRQITSRGSERFHPPVATVATPSSNRRTW